MNEVSAPMTPATKLPTPIGKRASTINPRSTASQPLQTADEDRLVTNTSGGSIRYIRDAREIVWIRNVTTSTQNATLRNPSPKPGLTASPTQPARQVSRTAR